MLFRSDRCHAPVQAGVRVIDSLLPGALADDWSEWLRQMAALDENCFAPALATLSDGKLDAIRLVMSDSTRLAEWTLTRSSMRKFWVRSSLSRLAP